MSTVIVRLKILLLLLTTSMVIIFNSLFLIIGMFLAVLVYYVAIVRRNNYKERIFGLGFVALSIVGFQLFFHTALSLQERIVIGGVMALRLMTLSFMVFLFTETTSVSEIVSALSFLPRKLNLMLTISFALLPSIMREMHMIRIAQQARGVKTNVLPIIIPLLHRTLSRAEHVAIVIETRGFEV
jgi:biotin transport system permease protein